MIHNTGDKGLHIALPNESQVPKNARGQRIRQLLAGHFEAYAIRFNFILVAICLVVAALSHVALIWDGSYYFFRILDDQYPYTPHNRWFTVPLHWIVLSAQDVLGRSEASELVFSLIYAMIPLLSLALSWWVVRDSNRALFVWPMLGIGIATLPGQIFLVAEAIIVVQLFWPTLLTVLVPPCRSKISVALLISIVLVLTHPISIGLLLISGVTACIVAVRQPSIRSIRWVSACFFLGLVGLSVARMPRGLSTYETEQLSWKMLQQSFESSLSGLPLAALICVYLAAIPLVGMPVLMRVYPRLDVRTTMIMVIVALLLAGGLLTIWAADTRLWASALAYKAIAAIVSLPFTGAAIWEALNSDGDNLQLLGPRWRQRLVVVNLTSWIFVLVIITQSLAWSNLLTRLRSTIAESPYTCIPMSGIGWLGRSPMNHWSVTALSVVLQGDNADKVVVGGDTCITDDFSAGLPLATWYRRQWNNGNLDLQPLGAQLRAEQQGTPASCWFINSSGWSWAEQTDTDWWRWGGDHGHLLIRTAEPIAVSLTATITSVQYPNRVTVLVNGTPQATLDTTARGHRVFGPFELTLPRQTNIVEFASHNRAVGVGGGRPRAIQVANLSISHHGGAISCDARR